MIFSYMICVIILLLCDHHATAAEYPTENITISSVTIQYTCLKPAKEDQIMNNYPVSLFKRHTSLRPITPICFLTNIFF
jgi:hypothetical protein